MDINRFNPNKITGKKSNPIPKTPRRHKRIRLRIEFIPEHNLPKATFIGLNNAISEFILVLLLLYSSDDGLQVQDVDQGG